MIICRLGFIWHRPARCIMSWLLSSESCASQDHTQYTVADGSDRRAGRDNHLLPPLRWMMGRPLLTSIRRIRSTFAHFPTQRPSARIKRELWAITVHGCARVTLCSRVQNDNSEPLPELTTSTVTFQNISPSSRVHPVARKVGPEILSLPRWP